MRWLELFGAKTDLSKIKMLFGNLDSGVFTRNDYAAAVYGFLCNKFANSEFSFLERLARSDPVFLSLFPEGLYFFDLTHSKSKVPFAFRRPDDFLEELKSRLYASDRDWKFSRSKDLSLVLFGTRDIPLERIGIISPIRAELSKQYRDSKREVDKVLGHYYRSVSEIVHIEYDLVSRAVRLYDALTNLEAIEYGNVRISPRPNDFLFDDRDFIDELRQSL